jgi:diguanylate cyclase (GGDEF)-like protein/PAS domain S-box-containing protein
MRLASTVFDASPGGIMVTDPDCRIIRVNKAFCAMTGYAEEDVLGKRPAILASGMHDELFFQQMWLEISERGRWEGEIMNRHHDGHILPEYLSICCVSDEKGGVVNYVGMLMDISERLKAQERIQYLAHHDYLTELPNRALLVERAEQALILAKRYQRRLAIIFMDLDQFKPINDNYGHNVGDKVLCMVARRLQSMVRRSDTVCRQGGDEFVIIYANVTWEQAVSFAEELRRRVLALEMEHRFSKALPVVTISQGVCWGIPRKGNRSWEFLHAADNMLYRVKKFSRNNYCVGGLDETEDVTMGTTL